MLFTKIRVLATKSINWGPAGPKFFPKNQAPNHEAKLKILAEWG